MLFFLYLQFQALRAMVQANPQILQVCPSLIYVSNLMFLLQNWLSELIFLLQPMLQELAKQNPHLLRLIQEHHAEFLQLINEPVEGVEG